MKIGIFKRLSFVFLVIAVIAVSGCSSKGGKAPAPDLTTESEPAEQLCELYIDKSFSWISENVGDLSFEYTWSGADHYSAQGSEVTFAFPSCDNVEECDCCSITAPFKSFFSDLAEKATATGFVSADDISEYFDSGYTYEYDEYEQECYVGMAYKKSSLKNLEYVFFFYPEEDGSCSVDSPVMAKVKTW